MNTLNMKKGESVTCTKDGLTWQKSGFWYKTSLTLQKSVPDEITVELPFLDHEIQRVRLNGVELFEGQVALEDDGCLTLPSCGHRRVSLEIGVGPLYPLWQQALIRRRDHEPRATMRSGRGPSAAARARRRRVMSDDNPWPPIDSPERVVCELALARALARVAELEGERDTAVELASRLEDEVESLNQVDTDLTAQVTYLQAQLDRAPGG